MERELAAYRARKKQELDQIGLHQIEIKKISTDLVQVEEQTQVSESRSDTSSESHSSNAGAHLSRFDVYLHWTAVVLKIILWSSLMLLAVKLQFGSVFFILTLFYLIATNLRTEPKRPGELSAYSVFNPNFEKLEGTLTAEQFERELVYGAGSIARS